MKILVTGRNGQVGWELQRSLSVVGQVVALDRAALDLSKPATLPAVIAELTPDVIVNAAAYTAVDKAEEEEALAQTVNAESVGVLAEQARAIGALFVHYSTEYVFDGTKQGAYVEEDEVNPLNAYGRSKLAGERAVEAAGGDWLVFRTSWVYGARGKNFLRTMLRLGAERETLNVVGDQLGAPTPARMIADATAQIVGQAQRERHNSAFERGTFHLTASGTTSWHGFASKIIDDARAILPVDTFKVQTVTPIPTSAYPTPARRPANSALDNTKVERRFGIVRPEWGEGVDWALGDLYGLAPVR